MKLGSNNDDEHPDEGPTPPPRATEGREAILTALWEAHGTSLVLRGIGKEGLAKSDAEDVAQLTFARMQEDWGRFDGGNAAGWMWQIWRYEIRTRRQIRRRHDDRHDGNGELGHYPGRDDTSSDCDRVELRAVLDVARAELAPVERLIFDAFGEKTDEAELIARIEADTGTKLKGHALRKRRQRLRTRLASQLALLGFP